MASRQRARERWCRYATSLAACLLLAGCGSRGPERVPVSGRISYGGGDWSAEGLITFNCLEPDPGCPRGSGVGRFDRQGNYTVLSHTGQAEGLYPGTYKLQIECWETRPAMDGSPGKSYVPATFAHSDDASLTVKVEAKTPLVHNFNVPKRSDLP